MKHERIISYSIISWSLFSFVGVNTLISVSSNILFSFIPIPIFTFLFSYFTLGYKNFDYRKRYWQYVSFVFIMFFFLWHLLFNYSFRLSGTSFYDKIILIHAILIYLLISLFGYILRKKQNVRE